jgi:hypothetical protein
MWQALKNLEQHQCAADNNVKIRLHVESSLNTNKQRLEMQIGKVIENDDVK